MSDRITVSIGVAGGVPLLDTSATTSRADSAIPAPDALKTIPDLFSRTDAALYAAKHGGRNRIVLHQGSG